MEIVNFFFGDAFTWVDYVYVGILFLALGGKTS